MKDYKYFGFSTRNRQLENCHFLIESKRYTFFLSVDNKNSYGVQNDDYLRILAIYSVLIVCIRNATSEKPEIFFVGRRESDVCVL